MAGLLGVTEGSNPVIRISNQAKFNERLSQTKQVMPGSAALHKEEDIKLEPDLVCYNYCDYNGPQSDPSDSYGDGFEDVKIKDSDAESKIVSNRPEKANSTKHKSKIEDPEAKVWYDRYTLPF